MEQRNNIITQEGKLRWHHGLGTAIAMVLIFSLVMNYIVPSRLPYVEAATVTKTWSADADFNNNDVTSEGATTIVQATTTGAGAVQLNLVGTSSVSEAFSDETNFNTGSSSAIISSGSLKIGSSSWTQTDWTDGTATTSTATGFSASTNITTSSGAFTATSGDGTLTSNIFNTKFADGGATWATSSWTTSATPTTTVKIRTSNDSAMSGATAFASCNSLTSGADISSNNCVTDGNQYVQYQVGLSLGTVGWNISPATSSLKSFSVTSQEGSPYTASFSSDGTKMYVVGLNNDRVYQYALSSAWDVSTASYASVSSSVASQDGTPTDISFSSDGTKMYMVGETNDKVHQYALSSAWDVSTASYASVSSSVTSQDGTPTDISFSSDGTKMYVVGLNNDRVYQYALSSAWDLSTASYASVSSSVTSQDSLPLGISFSSDGTKMYMVGQTNDKVHQYSLGTAWNVSTASYSSVSSSVSSQDGNSTDISFSSDGTKMYMVGITNDKVHQYSLGTAWDLSTVQVNWFSVTSQDTTPSDITFSSDGTKMYIMGYANNKVHQYALSTAWNVSTASYASVSSSVASQDTLPFGFTFSSDGTKMYMAGNTNDKVHQYALSSAWNVSTASYASVSSSVASQDSVPGGIAFSSDGTKMYILGNSSDKIYQYALGTAWDLSTASYASVSSSALTSQENSPRGIFFSSDGTKVYVDGETNDKVHQYSLGTAWNVSTISYANVSSSVSSQDGNPMGISFSSDGTKMYMVGSDTDAVYQYTLSTTTAAASLTDITINFTPASGVYRGESNTVDSLGTGIRFAKLGATSTPGTGSIAYYLSNDAGTNWSTTTVGTILTFSTTTGSALRWRADLTGNATVEDVSVDYNGYYATGTVRNLKIDANGDATWNTISWNVTAPAGTEAKFRTRGTNISEGEGALSSATWSSYYATSTNSATITSSSANPIFRWLEVEIFLNTGTGATDVNGGNTPSAEDFSLTYVINTPPQFDSTYGTQGQTVEQLATSSEDDWGKVRIIYSVRDTDTASGTLALQSSSTSFEYRLTSSDSWTAITNATLNSGATSSKTMSETVYSAVTRNVAATSTNAMWDAKTQLGQIYSTSVQTRVTVNDGDSLNNTSSSISAAFTLDTANPTSTTFRLDSSTSTNDVHFSFTDNTNIQYRFSSTSLTTSSEAVAWTSAGATSASGSSTPSGGFGGNASSGEIVYYQIRDSFGNYTTSSATAPGITGDNQTRITIKDTSNPTIGNYREFISWRAYVATSGATFSAYEVWRSTTTETAYTLLTSITDSAVNYYTDDAVSNGTTYYYKVRFKDTDTDYSAFSASATDAPDGQGGTDVVTPTITSIATSTVQTTWATVTWTTDELATSAVRVGTSALSYNTTST
ncbi:MAG: hypothetical protein Q8P01_00215, partial [bacterium]|nr:hypothetical protein [bacterium]